MVFSLEEKDKKKRLNSESEPLGGTCTGNNTFTAIYDLDED